MPKPYFKFKIHDGSENPESYYACLCVRCIKIYYVSTKADPMDMFVCEKCREEEK